MKKKTQKSSKIEWHKLLGKLLQDLLSPVDIQVYTEAAVMSESPRVDILLLKRNSAQWTAAQLALLPDGVRDTKATDILLEFKYSESLNDDAVQQTLSYDFLYRNHKDKQREQVQSFLLSARKPQKSTLKKLGYRNTDLPGVYRSQFRILKKVVLLSLNELSNEPHNAFVKCFASHRYEKQKAFELLEQGGLLKSLTNPLRWFITGLKGFWFTLKGDDMNIEMTTEQIADLGKIWGNAYLSSLPVEERLSGLKPEERLSGLKPEERLVGLKPEEIFAGFKPQERLAGLSPQELDELQDYLKKREQEK